MADTLETTRYYKLGGVNLKSSLYEMSTSQFLNIRNLDFDKPGALSSRPGQAYGANNQLTGPVISIFEFQKLTGESWIIANDSTALWYLYAGSPFQTFTLLSGGWNNGQPADMLTFVNRAWIANGQTALTWDGTTTYPLGLPCPATSVTSMAYSMLTGGATVWTTFGSFQTALNLTQFIGTAVFAAYSYIRKDGYIGPLDLTIFPVNINGQSASIPLISGQDVTALTISGFTAPANKGITSIALWLGIFPFTAGNYASVFSGPPASIPPGNGPPNGVINPNANINQFFLYTLLPASQQTAIIGFGGLQFSNFIGAFNQPFSGTAFCWFNTNTPKYLEINENYMFYSGFSNNPSNVQFSNLGQPEQLEALHFFEIRTNDGDRIYAQKAFNNQILFMKEHSFHVLVGSDPTNFQLVQISGQYGCISKRTVVEYNQKLLWLDRKGILEYNGAAFDIISTQEVEPMFRRMNLSAAKENACAVHHVYRNQIWWGIPIDGSTVNNITIVFDYASKQWTFFDGFNPASFGFIRNQLPKPSAWRGDYSGFIYYFSESLSTDVGGAFTCLAQTRFENVGGENQTSLWRRFFLDVTPITGSSSTISLTFFSNYDLSTVQMTGTAYQGQFQTRIETGIQAKSVAAQFAYLGASPITINGYAWAARGLRNV